MNPSKRAELSANIQRSALEDIARHLHELDDLESLFGFDLDVATEIYGESLLRPETGVKIVEAWKALLSALSEHPDCPFVFGYQYEALEPGCYGFGQEAKYDKRLALQGIHGASLNNIRYVRGDENGETPRIEIVGECYASPLQSSQGRSVKTLPCQKIESIVLAQKPTTSDLLLASDRTIYGGIWGEDAYTFDLMYGDSWRNLAFSTEDYFNPYLNDLLYTISPDAELAIVFPAVGEHYVDDADEGYLL